MAELDLDALEQTAREAGGGCWFSTGWTVGSRGFEVGDLKSRDRICSDVTERCAEFIAAANPATILELLDRLKAAEKERDALRDENEAMKQKEPVASIYIDGKGDREFDDWKCDLPAGSNLLYALPGAKGEEK